MENDSCSTCGYFNLRLMITSEKSFGYYGDIPCVRCSRYSTKEDLHTNKSTITIESRKNYGLT